MSNREKPRMLGAIAARLRKRLRSRRAIAVMLAFAALEIGGLVLAWSAWAGSANAIHNTVCVGGYGSLACSTNWRYRDDEGVTASQLKTADPVETAAAQERERKWVERCRPVVRQDALGVGRYHYAARGCEFGRAED
jgi:hypothetical protein